MKFIRLDEVARIYNGNSINEQVKAREFTNLSGGTPYIATKDISYQFKVNYVNGVSIPQSKSKEFKIARNGSVLLCAEGGSAGRKMALIDRDIFFVNKLFCFECSDELINKFLFYYLQAPQFQVLFKNSITGLIGGVSLEKVRSLPIMLPSLQKQSEIVEKLDKAFAEIDSLEKNLQLKEEKINQLLQSMLSAAFTYTEEFDVKVVKLKDVVSIERGSSFNYGIYIGLEDIEAQTGKYIGNFVPRKVKSLTFNFTSQHLLYGRLRPYLNKVLLPSFSGHCSTEIFPIMTGESLQREYLFYWLTYSTTVEKINRTATGTRMPRADMNKFLDLDFYLPELSIQQKIVAKLKSAFAEIDKLRNQIFIEKERISSLRQSILSNAFNFEEQAA